ncbi:Sapep family Mn(2+)-dependent dipeptidase [Ruminococcus sp. HUN007]|uniref:Sapep family Mn(2+)-dependent dipeptidase n=1 Tax=Ruminococcus sp. HUN007 TaxID=1514668 RepID=UPI000678BD38|nr:Sapep family Mn(2+)-dependent dipeptidase [Ruminococcus sp. HUN007]
MREKINAVIDKNFDEMISILRSIIAVPSVSVPGSPDMPYGKECARVLRNFLDTADEYGFCTNNFENYAGTVEYNEKPVKLGVLCHLDVVPVTEKDWTFKPFGGEISDGRIYGRGTIDDKGPAVAVLFALRALKELNIDLTHNVRFIVGCDEENGSTDMEYYMKRESMPELVFTPDGDYPVINFEKGMLRLRIRKNAAFSHVKMMRGGTVPNAVPSDAYAVVTGITHFNEAENITVTEKDGAVLIEFKGSAAHASTPYDGVNAVTGLVDYLCTLDLDTEERKTFENIKKAFVHGDFSGSGCGIKMSDKTGDLTEVLSIVSLDDGVLEFRIDVRYPESGNKEDIISKITETVAPAGFELITDIASLPHSVDENSDFIKTLLGVYERESGLKGYCKAIGGGTYVHDIEGGVAFGAEFPGEENNMHGNDESVSLDSLRLNAKIMANAIYEICK